MVPISSFSASASLTFFYKVVFAIGSNRIKVHGFAFHVGIDKLVIQHPRTLFVPGSTCNKQR